LATTNFSYAKEKQERFKGFVFSMLSSDSYWQIYRCDLGGGNLTQLSSSDFDKRYPIITSDEKIIFVSNDGKLFTMGLDGGNVKQIPLQIKVTQPKYSKELNEIVFNSFFNEFDENSDIWTLDLSTMKLAKIIRRPWMQLDPAFMGQNDILFVDAPELTGYEIYKFDLKNNVAIQLTQNDSYDLSPVFNKETKRIIYSSDVEGAFDIWTMNETGQDKVNLTKDSSDDKSPCFSSDGESVYFLSDRSGKYQPYRVDLKTKEETPVFTTNADILDFSVSD
jgi:Tol biopolymer transport system component